jgi:hypothetical protein
VMASEYATRWAKVRRHLPTRPSGRLPRPSFKDGRQRGRMSGQPPWSPVPPPQQMYDPNALLRHIDQTTTQTYHWIRIGIIVIIILLIAIVLIG